MNSALTLHRLHFAFTITYHYLFPRLTMGLALLIVIWNLYKYFILLTIIAAIRPDPRLQQGDRESKGKAWKSRLGQWTQNLTTVDRAWNLTNENRIAESEPSLTTRSPRASASTQEGVRPTDDGGWRCIHHCCDLKPGACR